MKSLDNVLKKRRVYVHENNLFCFFFAGSNIMSSGYIFATKARIDNRKKTC